MLPQILELQLQYSSNKKFYNELERWLNLADTFTHILKEREKEETNKWPDHLTIIQIIRLFEEANKKHQVLIAFIKAHLIRLERNQAKNEWVFALLSNTILFKEIFTTLDLEQQKKYVSYLNNEQILKILQEDNMTQEYRIALIDSVEASKKSELLNHLDEFYKVKSAINAPDQLDESIHEDTTSKKSSKKILLDLNSDEESVERDDIFSRPDIPPPLYTAPPQVSQIETDDDTDETIPLIKRKNEDHSSPAELPSYEETLHQELLNLSEEQTEESLSSLELDEQTTSNMLNNNKLFLQLNKSVQIYLILHALSFETLIDTAVKICNTQDREPDDFKKLSEYILGNTLDPSHKARIIGKICNYDNLLKNIIEQDENFVFKILSDKALSNKMNGVTKDILIRFFKTDNIIALLKDPNTNSEAIGLLIDSFGKIAQQDDYQNLVNLASDTSIDVSRRAAITKNILSNEAIRGAIEKIDTKSSATNQTSLIQNLSTQHTVDLVCDEGITDGKVITQLLDHFRSTAPSPEDKKSFVDKVLKLKATNANKYAHICYVMFTNQAFNFTEDQLEALANALENDHVFEIVNQHLDALTKSAKKYLMRCALSALTDNDENIKKIQNMARFINSIDPNDNGTIEILNKFISDWISDSYPEERDHLDTSVPKHWNDFAFALISRKSLFKTLNNANQKKCIALLNLDNAQTLLGRLEGEEIASLVTHIKLERDELEKFLEPTLEIEDEEKKSTIAKALLMNQNHKDALSAEQVRQLIACLSEEEIFNILNAKKQCNELTNTAKIYLVLRSLKIKNALSKINNIKDFTKILEVHIYGNNDELKGSSIINDISDTLSKLACSDGTKLNEFVSELIYNNLSDELLFTQLSQEAQIQCVGWLTDNVLI